MAIWRPNSFCLFCRCRQSVIGRRRARECSRGLQTKTASTTNGYFSNNHHLDGLKALPDPKNEASSTEDGTHHGTTRLPRTEPLSFEALYKFRDIRRKILLRLRNPWPRFPLLRPHNSNITAKKPLHPLFADLRLPEAKAALISHSQFRELLLHSGLHDKQIRRVLRAQLLRCQSPRDIYRIMAVALQTKPTAQSLAVLWEPLMRALYRCRNNVSDPKVLATLNVIIARFGMADLKVSEYFYSLGLRFAARTRSLSEMKKYLRYLRSSGIGINANTFRSVIAKFSIGHRGLGEIRNGRWLRSDLLQVLKGFDDCAHLPPDEQYHLGSFMDANDWQYLHAWVAVLARCRDADAVWRQWELWKSSPARLAPRRLDGWNRTMTTRKRGDYWFVEQMTMSGDLERAWKVVEQTGVNFTTLKSRVKMQLLDGAEFCGRRLWETGGVREALVDKYDHELSKIENAFGVAWRADEDGRDGEGVHELVQDQWEVLDRLGAEDWKMEEDYGFPYETKDAESLLLPREDRELHDAEEEELAGNDDGDS